MEIILGVLVSLVSQVSKKFFGTGEYQTLTTTVILAIVAAAGFTILKHEGYWESLLQVLTTAGAFYTFIIARFPKSGGAE